ncbi:MAG: alpha/beta fold hydrolase [Myxococcales bacterium]|nr:alpha/beta fold hydrolase [Myxococcales bacterium]
MVPDWLDRTAWPYTPRWHEGEHGRLHYVDEGQGPVHLFAHGTPTWALEWRHVIAGLRPHARCIAVDHLGFGLSEQPDAGYRPEDHAARFAAFADARDLHDATVVLHDFGGPIGLPWVLQNTHRIRRLVIINTWAWSLADQPRFALPARFLGSGLGRWLYGTFNISQRVIAPSAWADRSKWQAVAEQYTSVFPTYDSRTRVLWPLAKALLTSSEFYAGIDAELDRLADVAVDVIWGTSDPAFPPDVRDRWLSRLPHATRLDLPAGHWPHEESPDAVVDHLVDRLAPRASPGQEAS